MFLTRLHTGVISSIKSVSGVVYYYIDSIEISQIRTARSGSDGKMVVGRTDESSTLSANSYLSGVPLNSGIDYTWTIMDSDTESIVQTYNGREISVSGLNSGSYNILLEAQSLNTLSRHYQRGLLVEPPRFTAATCDLLINLNDVRNNTWVNPLGNLTYDGGATANFDFQGVVRPGFKIGISGSFTGSGSRWEGLIGTAAQPVRIQNVGGSASFTSIATDVLMEFNEFSNYITIDGAGTNDEYGFVFNGRTTSGTQSQLLYFIGYFISGIRIIKCDFNQQRGGGASDGGACIQFSPTGSGGSSSFCNGNIGDPGYYSAEYFEVIGNRIRNAWDEGCYIGYFQDSLNAQGYRPYRTGYVKVYRNSVDTCGRDPFQIASSDSMSLHDNYGRNNAREVNASHNSGISFNDGNRGTSSLFRNYFEDVDVFTSAQNGSTGDGSYRFYSNFGRQRETTLTSPNQFLFLNIETAVACHFEVLNNTFICRDVGIAPVCLQTDSPSTFFDPNFKYAYNSMITAGSDQSPYPELRRIGTPATSSGWLISNTWRRVVDEAEMLLNSTTYKAASKASPIFGEGSDLTQYNLEGGNYDNEGYPILVNRDVFGTDYTAGAFSSFEQYVLPDTTAPVFESSEITNILSTTLDIHVVCDEAAYLYWVVVPNNASAPTATEVFNGQASGGGAPVTSGNTLLDGLAVDITGGVTGLSPSTDYDIYIVAKDGDDNAQIVTTKLDATTLDQGVAFVEAGAGVARSSTGTLLPPYPTSSLVAGEIYILHASIRSSGGTIGTPAFWTLVSGPDQMGSTNNGVHYVFARISSGSESGTETITFPSDSGVTKTARMYRFKNNNTNLLLAITSSNEAHATNATVNARPVTTGVSNGMAVSIVAVADDNNLGAFTGMTGGTWENTAYYSSSLGSGTAIQLQTAEMPLAGTITGGSYAMAASDPYSVRAFAIVP